jgi:geranylgeranyl pyrophosphate synthase
MSTAARKLTTEETSWVTLLDTAFAHSALRKLLPTTHELPPGSHWQTSLHEPLKEFLSRPGKQFRARLVQFGWQLAGGSGDAPAALIAVVEGVHAGSLIIDDIQDASAYRRGGPTMHRLHGTPLAINAGNWLYFWPYALIEELSLNPKHELQVLRSVNRTLLRCHYGQALDLSVRVTRLSQTEIRSVVEATTRLKTGSLCALATSIGALALGSSNDRILELQRFGEELGCGLQMLDDWGSVVSAARWAKGCEDLLHARPVWPWAWLAEDLKPASFARLQRLATRVASRDERPEQLGQRMQRLVRSRGRKRIHFRLSAAITRLSLGFDAATIRDFESEIARLEESYE